MADRRNFLVEYPDDLTMNGILTIQDSGKADSAAFSHDGTDFNTALTNTTDWNVTGITTFQLPGSIKMAELAAAPADTAGYGQLWVKNTTPCQLWFTDDAGTDTQIV